ncbi:MAG TPA: NPCBM/NEW2 domain-containing protein [Pseudonocardiaceae bacterium]|nr:NPCBM/NEW2 domain-containing protein [Pseudonocardiaceae bacterium]
MAAKINRRGGIWTVVISSTVTLAVGFLGGHQAGVIQSANTVRTVTVTVPAPTTGAQVPPDSTTAQPAPGGTVPLTSVQSSGDSFDTLPQTIDGQNYPTTLTAQVGCSDFVVNYQLNGQYSKFTALFGVADASPQSQIDFSISADGINVSQDSVNQGDPPKNVTVELGKAHKFTLDISGTCNDTIVVINPVLVK